jgi:hypothetical protein
MLSVAGAQWCGARDGINEMSARFYIFIASQKLTCPSKAHPFVGVMRTFIYLFYFQFSLI